MPIIEELLAGLAVDVAKQVGQKVYMYVKTRPSLGHKTISDKYTLLVGRELYDFYRAEHPLHVPILGKTYVAPGSLIIDPLGDFPCKIGPNHIQREQ